MVLLHAWVPGDRVYCVSRPEIVGTVTEVLPNLCLVVIHPDDVTGFRCVFPSADLEFFTRPPLKSSHTPQK